MTPYTINGQTVEVAIIAADGASLNEPLTPREAWTVAAVDTFLKQNAEFQAAYPGVRLERVESNREVAENRQGRYYLRYHYDHGATEFWGYLSTNRSSTSGRVPWGWWPRRTRRPNPNPGLPGNGRTES